MIVIRRKKHCLFIKKCGHNRIDDSAGLACARRSLNICHRIFHGIMYCQQLIQIHPVVGQGDGVFLPSDRPAQQVAKKGFYRNSHFVLLVHLKDCLVFLMQIQHNIHAQTNDIRHVVHSHK